MSGPTCKTEIDQKVLREVMDKVVLHIGVPHGTGCSPGEVLQVRRLLSDGGQPRLVLDQLLLAL